MDALAPSGYLNCQNPLYEPHTFRQLVAQYVGRYTWLMFGIDMIFGAVSDEVVSAEMSMFLPEKLMQEMQEATLMDFNNRRVKAVVLRQQTLAEQRAELPSTKFPRISLPFVLCLLLFAFRICFFVFEIKKPRHKCRIFDSALLGLTALVGCVGFFLSFISLHPLVDDNYNLLWLFPLNLVAAALIWLRPMRKLLFVYFAFASVLMLFACIIYLLAIQSINIAFVPLMLALLTVYLAWTRRCWNTIKRQKHIDVA